MSLFRSLLLVIASSTQRELARQVRYLKVENEILRSKLPTRITIKAKERQRLVKFGSKLGRALHRLVTIVAPGTFLRWIREDKRVGGKLTKSAQRGRPRTAEEIRKLVIKLAKENAWGYARIVERFIGSIRRECLDHFVCFGTVHLDSVARVWIDHYHVERPHQGHANELLVRPLAKKRSNVADATAFSLREVRCRRRLGGLLKHYERIAA